MKHQIISTKQQFSDTGRRVAQDSGPWGGSKQEEPRGRCSPLLGGIHGGRGAPWGPTDTVSGGDRSVWGLQSARLGGREESCRARTPGVRVLLGQDSTQTKDRTKKKRRQKKSPELPWGRSSSCAPQPSEENLTRTQSVRLSNRQT